MRKTKDFDSSSEVPPKGDSHACMNFEKQECYTLEPVTKVIKKKKITKKRAYTNISNELRQELIEGVHVYGESIKEVSNRLGIKYSCAKAICQVYKREGRSDKKLPGSKSFQKQIHQEIQESTVISSSLATSIQPSKNESSEIRNSLICDSSLYQQQRTAQITPCYQHFAIQKPSYIALRVNPQPFQNVCSVSRSFQSFTSDSWALTQENLTNLSFYAELQANIINQHIIQNPIYYTFPQNKGPQFLYCYYSS